jgi:hypothetical protein
MFGKAKVPVLKAVVMREVAERLGSFPPIGTVLSTDSCTMTPAQMEMYVSMGVFDPIDARHWEKAFGSVFFDVIEENWPDRNGLTHPKGHRLTFNLPARWPAEYEFAVAAAKAGKLRRVAAEVRNGPDSDSRPHRRAG